MGGGSGMTGLGVDGGACAWSDLGAGCVHTEVPTYAEHKGED